MRNTVHLVRCGNLMAAAAAPSLDPCSGLGFGVDAAGDGSGGDNGIGCIQSGVGGSGGMPGRREVMLRGHINQFTSSTTAHGLNRANTEQSWVRMLWVGIVVAASMGAIVHTTKQVTTYLQYPVSSTNRQEPNSFEFPDLTFCDPLNKRFFHWRATDLAKNVSRYNEMKALYSLVYSHFKTEKDWRKERRAIELLYNTFEHLFNITSVNIRPLDVVLYCTFDGEPCDHRNFQVFYHRQYTNCFTFKPQRRSLRSSGMDRGLFLLLYVPSADYHLPLDVLARLASGLENNGIRFQIHQRDTIPHPLEYGIMAPTGTLTAVGLEQLRTSLADTPTHPCVRDTKLRLYDNQFDFMREYDRQLFDCVKHEHQLGVRDQCGCTMEDHVIAGEGFDPRKERFCHDVIDVGNASRVKAVTELYIDVRNGTEPILLPQFIKLGNEMRARDAELNASLHRMLCSDNASESALRPQRCYDSCRYNKYEYSLSQCPWPEDSFLVRNAEIQMVKIAELLDLYRKLNAEANPKTALLQPMEKSNLDTNSCQTHDTQNMSVPDKEGCSKIQLFVRRSVVQLRVYPETLTVRHTIEERSYELVNLCSDLGGVLGLWIGFSIVTLFEFAEFFIICASYYWYLCLSKLPKTQRNPLRIPKILSHSHRRQERRDIELAAASSASVSPVRLHGPRTAAAAAAEAPVATGNHHRQANSEMVPLRADSGSLR